MGFGAHGLCGQRVRPVAAQGLGRGNDRAIVQFLNLAASLAVAPRDKLETAVTGRVQWMVITRNGLPGLSVIRLVVLVS